MLKSGVNSANFVSPMSAFGRLCSLRLWGLIIHHINKLYKGLHCERSEALVLVCKLFIIFSSKNDSHNDSHKDR